MIKVIFFDLGGVLFTNGTKEFIAFAAEKYNRDHKRIKEIMDGEVGSKYRQAIIGRDEFWQTFLQELNLSEDSAYLEREWLERFTLIEGTKKLIEELSRKYRIHFLSDNVQERITLLDNKYHFLSFFEGGVFSIDLGVRKPHPYMYHFALEKVNVRADEAVFIDDKPEFLIPAKKIGMVTFVFISPEKLRQDLKKNSILL